MTRLATWLTIAIISMAASTVRAVDAGHHARVADALVAAFADIPPDRIPTGILYDRVVSLSNVADHDGASAEPRLRRRHWRQMYYEMRHAATDGRSWPTLATITDVSAVLSVHGQIPITAMNFRYNQARPDAFNDGSLRVAGDHIEIGQGNPFEEKRAFALAAAKEQSYRGAEQVFILPRELYFTNDEQPTGIRIDFGDGLGPRSVRFDEPQVVRYTTPGPKTITCNMSFAAGMTLVGGIIVDVITLQAPSPDDTLSITATIPFNSEFGTGDAYVYLSDGHSTVTDPIIVTDGFDLDNTLNWDELYDLLNDEGLVESLRTDGYDVVALNYTDATDYIQKNAFVLTELIEVLKSMIDPGQSIALVGPSMGGLVSRYALSYMELNGLEHRVRTLICFDTPHRGANIPLGIQYWLSFFSGLSADAEFLLSRLDRPAARQMLVYHYTDPPGTSGESDPLHAAFLADLAAVGGYPTQSRNVAVANGSGNQMDQGFNAGDQIISYEYNSLLVDITGNVWAVPDASSQMIFDGLIDIILTQPNAMSVSVSSTQPYDSAPGGSRASMADMDSTEAPYGDIVALHDVHCFIPTTSALDLDTTDVFFDIAGAGNLDDLTPFDAVYYPTANQPHVDITPENAVWVRAELQDTPTGIDVQPPARPAVTLRSFPNPFNPTTTIEFVMPNAGPATLAIYDAQGRFVVRLFAGQAAEGANRFRWAGQSAGNGRVASGVYFARLDAADHHLTHKVILLK